MATVNGTAGNDFIHLAGDGLVAPEGYNDVTGVTAGDDTITGGDGDDIIYGGDGLNAITGGLGADTLFGGAGSDIFYYNSAAEIPATGERIFGGSGTDYIWIESVSSIDISAISITDVEGLVTRGGDSIVTLNSTQLSIIKTIQITTISTNTDIVLADSGRIRSEGVLYSNVDNIFLADGDNTVRFDGEFRYGISLVGNIGDDTIKIVPIQSNIKATTITLDGGAGDDILELTSGLGELFGRSGNDTLVGGKLSDHLLGGGGNDILEGGGKQDTLTGGTGADIFQFKATKESGIGQRNHDIVTDFSPSDHDLIDLSAIDADVLTSGNQSFVLGGQSFTNTAGELVQFFDAGGKTLLQGDVNGDGVADFEIQFSGNFTFVAQDFLL